MDLTQLKTQVMTMFMINNNRDHSGSNSIHSIIYTMLLMNVIEAVFRNAPGVFARAQQWIWSYFMRKTQQAKFAVPMLGGPEKKEETASITLIRKYSKSDANNKCIEKVDGIIEYLCNTNASKHIQLDQRYTLNTTDFIEINSNITAKVLDIRYNEQGDLENIHIRLFSYTLSIHELRDWVDEVHRNYCYEKNNKLGNKKFFFNEVATEPQRQMVRNDDKQVSFEYNWATAPSALTFTMNEFKTAKSFKNVFGEHVGELKERLNLFQNHPEWYQERGIPHSLGILLHGIPGAGKTSTIKAIARDTGRHIFNLSLRSYTTQRQLMNLFFNEVVQVGGPGAQPQTFNIPLNQRIYVIEDIDCLTDVVFNRAERDMKATAALNGSSDAVNLGFLLNLLDGVLETPGRILVITSNYPDRLDHALVRPGRIDVRIQFSWADRAMISEMLENFYGRETDVSEIPAELEGVLSPAEVLESLCTNFKSSERALEHMLRRVRERQATTDKLLGTLVVDNEAKDETKDDAKDEVKNGTKDEVKDEVKNGTKDEAKDGSPVMKIQENKQFDYNKKIIELHAHKSQIESRMISPPSSPESEKKTNGILLDQKTTKHNKLEFSVTPMFGNGSMFEKLDYVKYDSGNDITFISPEKAAEFAQEYSRRQQHDSFMRNIGGIKDDLNN